VGRLKTENTKHRLRVSLSKRSVVCWHLAPRRPGAREQGSTVQGTGLVLLQSTTVHLSACFGALMSTLSPKCALRTAGLQSRQQEEV
jgi:hypothetical protein